MMHAGKCKKCGREDWDPEGKRNNELTLVVKPHLLYGVNVGITFTSSALEKRMAS